MHYLVLILGYKRQRDFVGRYIRQAQRAAWGEEGKPNALKGVRGLGVGVAGPGAEEAEGATVIDDDYEVTEAPRNRRERRAQEKETRKGKKEKGKKRDRSRSVDPSGTVTPSDSGQGASAPVAGTVTPAPGPKKQVEAENGKLLVVDSEGKVFLEEEDEERGESQLFLLDPEEIEKPTFKQTVLWRLPVWVAGTIRDKVKGEEKGVKGGEGKGQVEREVEEEEMGDVIVVSKEEGMNGGKASVNGETDLGGSGKKSKKRTKGKK